MAANIEDPLPTLDLTLGKLTPSREWIKIILEGKLDAVIMSLFRQVGTLVCYSRTMHF